MKHPPTNTCAVGALPTLPQVTYQPGHTFTKAGSVVRTVLWLMISFAESADKRSYVNQQYANV